MGAGRSISEVTILTSRKLDDSPTEAPESRAERSRLEQQLQQAQGLSGLACHDLEFVISREREVSSNRLLLLRPILETPHKQVHD